MQTYRTLKGPGRATQHMYNEWIVAIHYHYITCTHVHSYLYAVQVAILWKIHIFWWISAECTCVYIHLCIHVRYVCVCGYVCVCVCVCVCMSVCTVYQSLLEVTTPKIWCQDNTYVQCSTRNVPRNIVCTNQKPNLGVKAQFPLSSISLVFYNIVHLSMSSVQHHLSAVL